MRSLYLLFLITLFIFISSVSSAKNQIVHFEPKKVELNGIIRILKFPGPPNYESIKNGDVDETGVYLILNYPIDVNLMSNFQIGNDKPVKNVKLIQLIVHDENDWKKIKEGNYVHIIGTLSSALTGHHHARLLIRINKINVLSKQKIVRKELYISNEDWQFLKHENLQE